MPRFTPSQRIALTSLMLLGCETDAPRCVDGDAFWGTTDARCVDGDLIVQGRTDDELTGLVELEEITGSLVVFDNPELVELPAMLRLVRLGGSLSIADNAALATVGGFPALAELAGGVFVAENPALGVFDLGPAVVSLRSLDLTANPALAEVRAPALIRVTEVLRIARNDALASIRLPALAQLGALALQDDAALAELDLPALHTIDGDFTIEGVGRIESLAGLPALAEVGRAAHVAMNPALTEIEWRAASTGELTILGNDALRQVRGAASVTAIGALGILQNPALAVIDGFEGLTTVGSLIVADNTALQALASMPEPSSMPGTLRIYNNPSLVAPPGWLAKLEWVGQSLWIVDNDSMSIEAIDALVARLEVGGPVRVGDNGGEDTALDPCPWTNDYLCDAGRDTDLCVTDVEDCDG